MCRILEVTLNKVHLRLLKGVCREKGRCLLGLADEKWGWCSGSARPNVPSTPYCWEHPIAGKRSMLSLSPFFLIFWLESAPSVKLHCRGQVPDDFNKTSGSQS